MIDLMSLLRDCYHPVLRRNIVELGLVRSATAVVDDDAPGAGVAGNAPRYIATITMTAPGNDEAANAQLQAQVENRLLGLPQFSRVDVTMLPPVFQIL